MKERCQELLLAWYDRHARLLPWRGIHDPYCTWVSETMLQQTRVETVLGYYERFLQRFPTIEALANAPLDDVLKLWEGLGYYSRARNLHKGARQVMELYQGEVPKDITLLRKISGIGPYTAGAIASIAYDQPVAAVDGNVIRVVSRLRGIRENVGIPSIRRTLEAEAEAMVPQTRPGDFNQALMDLGSSVCVPGTPSCERCPLQTICDAYDAGDADELPVLPRKTPPKPLFYDVCLVFSGDRVLMQQRTERMLNGLWVYPMVERQEDETQFRKAVRRMLRCEAGSIQECGEARHVFSHQVWNMRLYTVRVDDDHAAPAGMRYVTLDEMKELAVPSAMRTPFQTAAELLSCAKSASKAYVGIDRTL